jgi:hypothetical protein
MHIGDIMADYAYVDLTILSSDIDKAISIIEKDFSFMGPVLFNYLEEGNARISTCSFDEVKWGELPFLDAFANEGIPYEANTSGDYNISEVDRYCRYTADGKKEVKELYEDSDKFSLSFLLQSLDRKDAPEFLIKWAEAKQKEIEILSWENQEENKKTYLMHKLLGVKE